MPGFFWPLDTLEKGIAAAFVANPAARAMTADKADFIPQGQDLVAYRSQQGLVIAAWQIGPADRTVEQDIAQVRESLVAIVIDDVSG